MVDAAHVLRRLHDRHAQQHTRESTAGFPAPRRAAPAAPLAAAAATGGAVESADDGSDDAAYATPDDDRRKPGGTLLIAGLLALVALAAVAGALLLLDGSPDRESTSTLDTPSASSPAAQPNRSGRRTRSQAVPSVTPTPTTSVPTPTPSAPDSAVAPTTAAPSTASPQSRRRASGADAEQFVRSYYAALPVDPQSAWSALSPSFQDQIGEYDDYRAFWSTISAVTVNDTTPAGDGAVDVSLTYTTDDGRVESEVRRVFLAREDTGYLIVDDAIVG